MSPNTYNLLIESNLDLYPHYNAMDLFQRLRRLAFGNLPTLTNSYFAYKRELHAIKIKFDQHEMATSPPQQSTAVAAAAQPSSPPSPPQPASVVRPTPFSPPQALVPETLPHISPTQNDDKGDKNKTSKVITHTPKPLQLAERKTKTTNTGGVYRRFTYNRDAALIIYALQTEQDITFPDSYTDLIKSPINTQKLPTN